LFVAYIHLFTSAIDFFKRTQIHALNVYRVGIPIFVGAVIMSFPSSYFDTIPAILQPFLSNGLLVGILLALVLDNAFRWGEDIALTKESEKPSTARALKEK